MQSADVVLTTIRERGERGLPLERIYRQMFNPALYLMAYGKIYRNQGATTPGVTSETVDGMSQRKIAAAIELLRQEKYRWHPVRRVSIEKKNSTKKRPLGLPTWTDKLVQEVIRLILEAYYDPQFSPASHGYRPNHGCHTALHVIQRTWNGTKWFIEADICKCFDNLDHEVLLSILAEKIHDNRFLRLIQEVLDAGYLEDWTWNATLSGTPQGGIISPILANIYLDRLDKFVESTLIPAYSRGELRRTNPAYTKQRARVYRARHAGHRTEAKRAFRALQELPYGDQCDPSYRRLRYARCCGRDCSQPTWQHYFPTSAIRR